MSVFIIDDHPLIREALGALIRRMGLTAVELASVSDIAPAQALQGAPGLICLEILVAGVGDASVIGELRLKFPTVPLVVLSAAPEQAFKEVCLAAGAHAYIHKSASAADISAVIRSLLTGDSGSEEPAAPGKLSKRQKQLLTLIDKGMSNRDIADALQISEHTVKVHLWRLFRRLDVKSRSQASHLARTQGLL